MSTRPLERTAAQHQQQQRYDLDDDKAEDARLARLRKGYAWETTTLRSWDQIEEDPRTGRLKSHDKSRQILRKRRRESDSLSGVRRGVIRYCVLVVDMSAALANNDYKPSRAQLLAASVSAFAARFFDHNPLSQLALVATRDADATKLCAFASAPRPVEDAMRAAVRIAPAGHASLQNALELAGRLCAAAPPYALREALVCFGSLSTCDPGDVHATIDALAKDRVRVCAVAMAAELHVLKTLAAKTGGSYVVAMDEAHFRDALDAHVVPPPTTSKQVPASLIRMGFPPLRRLLTPRRYVNNPALAGRLGYECPRCAAWLSDMPCECTLCGLTLVSSPHLARSYHHLFPVPKYTPLDPLNANAPNSDADAPLPLPLTTINSTDVNNNNDTSHERVPDPMLKVRNRALVRCTGCTALLRKNAVLRVVCPSCLQVFCADCDAFVHESLHQCPGCALTSAATPAPMPMPSTTALASQ